MRALEVPELNDCVILDTSVLIDLERGAILETIFRLPFNCAVPSLLYRMELKEYGGDALIDLGLRLEELDAEEVTLAQSYSLRRRALSVPDALALAKSRSWILLSGDRKLVRLAQEEEVAVHGVLWLFDRVYDEGIADGTELCAGLRAITAHPRCRLPKEEIEKRLQIYCDL